LSARPLAWRCHTSLNCLIFWKSLALHAGIERRL
jgi:hypothetical protein